jgi:hypothetical protein
MWQYEDVVLLMRPMVRFLEERRDAVELSKAQAKQAQAIYARDLQRDESQIENPVFEDRRII